MDTPQGAHFWRTQPMPKLCYNVKPKDAVVKKKTGKDWLCPMGTPVSPVLFLEG